MTIPFGLNAAFALSSGALGKRLDPYQGFNFLIEVDGLLVGGFSRVEGLEGSIEVQDYSEGGVNGYVHKIVKGATFPNLVLTHGLTDIDALWKWYDDTRSGAIRRRNGTIMLLDPQRLPAKWWNFRDALPVKWSGPTLDAGQDGQIAIERLELVHRGLSLPLASKALATVRLGAALAK